MQNHRFCKMSISKLMKAGARPLWAHTYQGSCSSYSIQITTQHFHRPVSCMYQLVHQYSYWKSLSWLTQIQLCGNASTAHCIRPTSFKVIRYSPLGSFRKLFAVILIDSIWNFVLLMFSSVCRIVHSRHRGMQLFRRSSSCCFHLQMLLFFQIRHLLNVASSRELKISVWADRNFNLAP